MKKVIVYALLALSSIFFVGCWANRTSSQGLEDESYLAFVGTPKNYEGGVNVTIDEGKNIFVAEVSKDYTDRPTSKIYAISKGNHTIRVAYGGGVIYQKQIFISSQETKKIILP